MKRGQHDERACSFVEVDAAVALVASRYDARSSVRADLMVRCTGEPIWFTIAAHGDAYDDKEPRGGLRAILSPYRLFDLADHVDMPPPESLDEALAIRAHVWAREVDGLLYGMSGAGAEGGFAMAALCHEGGWVSPFDSIAVAHAHEESLTLDFARGWLNRHAGVWMDAIADAPAEDIRRQIELANDVWTPLRYDNLFPYDGSLTRTDVLRVLDHPPREVFQAIEAVTVPSAQARQGAEVARELIRALESGSTRVTVKIPQKRRPYTPRLGRLPNGALVLHAGPRQNLWPIYRDAASLLLGR